MRREDSVDFEERKERCGNRNRVRRNGEKSMSRFGA